MVSSVASAAPRPVITDAERDRDADRKDIHPHPYSRPFRQADHRLPEGEAAGSGGDGTGRQRRRNAERDECGGVSGDNRGGWRMSNLKVTQCKGDGQGSCKMCSDNGKWNRTWMCFLYKIEGYEGCYCSECVKKIMEGSQNE